MSPATPAVKAGTPAPVEPVSKSEQPSPLESESRPITILTELDSYISERMKGQPRTLEDVADRIEVLETHTRHRLSLPGYFEKLSADHKEAGPYVFRWVFKDKRAIDRSLNLGWVMVNRSYFPSAPRYLFTANGGIEVGDALLTFMPSKKAKAMRAIPGEISRDRLKGQMTQVKPDYVLMTGNAKSENVYQPELGPEAAETSEEKVPGVMTEGRDF